MISNVEEIEDAILDKTAEIWNMFLGLEQTHPSDINDLGDAIHDIQKIISVRVARRVKPDKFVTVKEKKRNSELDWYNGFNTRVLLFDKDE
jgi:hypothetical protein